MNRPKFSRKNLGFTLIEIMVVLLVISVILAFSIPALEPAVRGSKLKRAADDLERALANAQQVALTENAVVQFRFFRYADDATPGDEEHFRGYESVILRYNPDKDIDNPDVEPVSDVVTLPAPYIVSASPIFSSLTNPQFLKLGSDRIPRSDAVADFLAFEFRPDGTTNLSRIGQEFWTVTIMSEVDEGGPLPKEFVTLSLDPFNGQVRRYQ